jgi:hypothetical protein
LVIALVQAQALSPLDFDRKSTGEKSALIREKLEEKAKVPQAALANQRPSGWTGGVACCYRRRHWRTLPEIQANLDHKDSF